MSQQLEDTLLIKRDETDQDLLKNVKQSTRDLPELRISAGSFSKYIMAKYNIQDASVKSNI